MPPSAAVLAFAAACVAAPLGLSAAIPVTIALAATPVVPVMMTVVLALVARLVANGRLGLGLSARFARRHNRCSRDRWSSLVDGRAMLLLAAAVVTPPRAVMLLAFSLLVAPASGPPHLDEFWLGGCGLARAYRFGGRKL